MYLKGTLQSIKVNKTRLIMVLVVTVILFVFWPGQQSLASPNAYAQQTGAGISTEGQNYTGACCVLIIGPGGGCGAEGKARQRVLLTVLQWVFDHFQGDSWILKLENRN